MSFETKTNKETPNPQACEAFFNSSTPFLLGTQTMTPWYGTTSILLAAQLNKKFPGGAFLSKQCQRFGERSEREFCDLLY